MNKNQDMDHLRCVSFARSTDRVEFGIMNRGNFGTLGASLMGDQHAFEACITEEKSMKNRRALAGSLNRKRFSRGHGILPTVV